MLDKTTFYFGIKKFKNELLQVECLMNPMSMDSKEFENKLLNVI